MIFTGCSWTTFDSLTDQMWVRSTKTPDVVPSSDFAIAIVGATADTSTSGGGRLAISSADSTHYTLLGYDAKGADSVIAHGELAQDSITSLGPQPLIVSDGMGHAAVVAPSIDQSFIGMALGPAEAVQKVGVQANPSTPDAATFDGASIVVTAGPNLYAQLTTGPSSGQFIGCALQDMSGTAIGGAAAIAADSKQNLWVWSESGSLLMYSPTTLASCKVVPSPLVSVKADASVALSPSFAPATGSHILPFVWHPANDHDLAILAGHNANGSEVIAVDLTMAAVLAAPLTFSDVLAGASLLYFSPTAAVLALGFPQRGTGGEVELRTLASTFNFTMTPDEKLSDDQPSSGESFGRDVAALTFNGIPTLTVAAKSEVFTYFRTLTTLQTDHRQH